MGIKLRSKIKEALTTRKTSQWNPDTKPNLYATDKFLRKSGYRLVDAISHEGTVELIIEPVKEGHLHPEIQLDPESGRYEIKVVSYGFLPAIDIEDLIKGYTKAIEIAKYLDSLNKDRLEVEKTSNKEEKDSE